MTQLFPPFYNTLLASGQFSHEQIKQALILSKRDGRSPLRAIEKVTGKLLSPELTQAYKEYHLFELKIVYGVDSLDPEIASISAQAIAELSRELGFSFEEYRRYQMLPFAKQTGAPATILVAMVNPDNLDAQDELYCILKLNHRLGLRRLVITQEDFDQLIEQCYKLREELEEAQKKNKEKKNKEKEIEQLSDIMDILSSFENGLTEEEEDSFTEDFLISKANQPPVINLVNKILAQAIHEEASEIHIEPQENYFNIRFRLDGVLHQAFEPLPRDITSALVNRFKIMAYLDISQNQLPQTGLFRRVYQGRTVDFITHITVSPHGEQVVLTNLGCPLGIDKLISQEKERNLVRQLMGRSSGLLMAIGPDEAFLSKFVDNILAELNTPEKNVVSVRLHLTNAIDGVLMMRPQSPGEPYLNLLKSCLYQDCDIVLVDQIRDQETAQLVVELAFSGRLMITTLSSPNFEHSFAKLTQMGMTAANLYEVLVGIIHQRSLRKLCPKCRFAAHYTDDHLANFGLSNQPQLLTFYKAKVLSLTQIEEEKKSGKLCQKCQGKGYKGLVDVYEVMEINSTLKKLILHKASPETIYAASKQSEMSSLLDNALNFAQEGDTTLEEIQRIMPDLIEIRNQPIMSHPNSPQALDVQTSRNHEVSLRDRIIQLENLAQSTQNNVNLGLQSLQEQMRAIQQQLAAIAQANPSHEAKPIRPPRKVYSLPPDPWN